MRVYNNVSVASVTVHVVSVSVDWKKNGSQELDVDSPNGLNPEEYEVYEVFTDYINDDVNRAVTEYADLESQNGRILNTDIARELSEHYKRDPIQWTEAVHEPASALVKEIFYRRLNSEDLNHVVVDPSLLLLLGGGPGAGKTTGTEVAAEKPYKRAHSVYDTTLANKDSARQKIRTMRNAGKVILVIYVHCPVLTAVERAFIRGLKTGRVVPIDVLVECHIGAQDCIRYLMETYESDKRVGFRIIDNGGSIDDINLADLSSISSADTDSTPELIRKAVEVIHEQRDAHRGGEFRYDADRVAEAFRSTKNS